MTTINHMKLSATLLLIIVFTFSASIAKAQSKAWGKYTTEPKAGGNLILAKSIEAKDTLLLQAFPSGDWGFYSIDLDQDA